MKYVTPTHSFFVLCLKFLSSFYNFAFLTPNFYYEIVKLRETQSFKKRAFGEFCALVAVAMQHGESFDPHYILWLVVELWECASKYRADVKPLPAKLDSNARKIVEFQFHRLPLPNRKMAHELWLKACSFGQLRVPGYHEWDPNWSFLENDEPPVTHDLQSSSSNSDGSYKLSVSSESGSEEDY